jgi:hypothetical protein
LVLFPSFARVKSRIALLQTLVAVVVMIVSRVHGGEQRDYVDRIKESSFISLTRVDKLLDGGSYRFEFAFDVGRGVSVMRKVDLDKMTRRVFVNFAEAYAPGQRFVVNESVECAVNDPLAKALADRLKVYAASLPDEDLRKTRALFLAELLTKEVAGKAIPRIKVWETYE